jgi:hypothetical protein
MQIQTLTQSGYGLADDPFADIDGNESDFNKLGFYCAVRVGKIDSLGIQAEVYYSTIKPICEGFDYYVQISIGDSVTPILVDKTTTLLPLLAQVAQIAQSANEL